VQRVKAGRRNPEECAMTVVDRAGVSRRSVVKGGLAAAAGVLAAPWVTNKARAAGTLNVVLNQGLLAKLWIDHLNPVFERTTGATLNVQQSVTGQMLAMLASQRDNPPDLMQFSEAGVFQARDRGLLRAHNLRNMPNAAFLRPSFKLADDYSVGVIDAVNTLFYNNARVTEAPKSWAEMWDPKNRNRIAVPPIAWNNGVRMVTTAAQVVTGKPLKEATQDWEAGLAHLAKLKANGAVAYTGAPQAIQMLQSGQVPLVPFYGVFINPLVDSGAPIRPAHPMAEGMHGEIVGLNMPVNAKNVELAEAYVNLSLSKDFQSLVDSVLRTRSANSEVNPSPRTLELLGPPENIQYADWAFLAANRAKMTEKWNEVFG
jgi:putative spermidine/putrescine transport system substrate-binding protein